jgi:hypothetical protein
MRHPATSFAVAAVLLTLGLSPAGAWVLKDNSNSDSDMAPVPDWAVFGFDISSVPGDIPSLMAFKASLDPRLQEAINRRCRHDIGITPWRYSPKVRAFCWGH